MKHAAVNADFFIMRQNKRFCLYAGLLDAAHRSGLRRIHTRLVQAPTEANGQTAIVEATATFDDEGVRYAFDGIGDASPQNVGRMIAVHIIRMAETRSKARALRDALNIEVAAVEEMDMSEYAPDSALAKETNRQIAVEEQARAKQPARPTPKAERQPAQIVPASAAQRARVALLRRLLGQREISTQALTAPQAAAEIAHWEGIARSQPATEQQWTNLVAAAQRISDAGGEMEMPESMSIAEYEQHVLRFNVVMRELTAKKQPATAGK